MKLGIESMFQILLLCVSVYCLLALIGINQYLLDARRSLDQYVDQIELSSNREKTFRKCEKDAENRGYELSALPCNEKEDEDLLLTLSYTVSFHGEKLLKGVVQAYAR